MIVRSTVHVSGFKSEWHENFYVSYYNMCVFVAPKITKFGDKQASRIGVRTKYFFVRCTRTTNLEAWAPQLECLGARRSPQNFYLGNQL